MAEQTPLSQIFNDDLVGYGGDNEYGHLQGPVDSNIHFGNLLQPTTMIEDDFDRDLRRILAPDQSDSNPNSIPASPSKKRAAPADDISSNDISSNDISEHVSKRQKTSSAWFGVGDPIYCNFGHIRFNGLYRVERIEEDEVVLRKTWPSEGAGREERVTVRNTEAKLEKKIWINAKDHPVMPPEC